MNFLKLIDCKVFADFLARKDVYNFDNSIFASRFECAFLYWETTCASLQNHFLFL